MVSGVRLLVDIYFLSLTYVTSDTVAMARMRRTTRNVPSPIGEKNKHGKQGIYKLPLLLSHQASNLSIIFTSGELNNEIHTESSARANE